MWPDVCQGVIATMGSRTQAALPSTHEECLCSLLCILDAGLCACSSGETGPAYPSSFPARTRTMHTAHTAYIHGHTHTPCRPRTRMHTHAHTRTAHTRGLTGPSTRPQCVRPGPWSPELACALNIAVSDVMDGKAFALLFLLQLRGLNHVGK